MGDKTIRVLLVEDNPGDVRLVQEGIREAGGGEFRLVRVGRLADALRHLKREHFDAVLLDLSLPDSHGLDTFLDAHSEAPGVPIVVLTGLGDETLAVEAVRQGAQDYLTKGEVDGSQLVRAVRYAIERHRRPSETAIREGLSKIFHVLQRSGLRVTESRLDDLMRAVAARSRAAGDPSIDKYFSRLTARGMADQEFRELVKVLTVGETFFFRTPNHMWAFRDDLLPQVLAARDKRAASGESSRPITIWSPGCATGEEPYSLALVIEENRRRFGNDAFRILGTDINEDSLKTARAGEYGERSVKPLPPGYLERYFTRKGDRYMLSAEIRRMVEFRYHNLLEPTFPFPISAPNGVDIIFCRNVFIYFSDEIVNDIAARFFKALVPGGFVVVGHSETLDQVETGCEMVFLSGAYIYRKPMGPGQQVNQVGLAAAERTLPGIRGRKRPSKDKAPSREPEHTPAETAQALTEEARQCADRGEYEEAVRKATKALELDDGYAGAHCVIGLVQWSRGSMEEAVASFEKAAELDREFALPRYYMAEAERRAGHGKKAARLYTDAIGILERKPPDDPVWGSETVTNAGLAAMCEAGVERVKGGES